MRRKNSAETIEEEVKALNTVNAACSIIDAPRIVEESTPDRHENKNLRPFLIVYQLDDDFADEDVKAAQTKRNGTAVNV